MSTLTEVRDALTDYATERKLWLSVSGVYDLFPGEVAVGSPTVSHRFPEAWPQGSSQGVYLFFGRGNDPLLLYVGKSSGRTSSMKARLDGYIDRKVRRSDGECVLREVWNGYRRPWRTNPRYMITVALQPDGDGRCSQAELLEAHLIRHLRPTENIQGATTPPSVMAPVAMAAPHTEGHGSDSTWFVYHPPSPEVVAIRGRYKDYVWAATSVREMRGLLRVYWVAEQDTHEFHNKQPWNDAAEESFVQAVEAVTDRREAIEVIESVQVNEF